MSTLPLFTHDIDAVLAVHRGRALTTLEFLGAARALATRLPSSKPVLLLCENRVAFAVGFAATLLRGVTAMLPPSRAPHALEKLARSSGAALALVDAPVRLAACEDIVVDPWCGAASAKGVPRIPGNHVAAIVHTSGTTGDAQPHAKTWSSLVRGARALRERIAFTSGAAIVGAVPAQHMWGLEATIMLALQGGGIVQGATPLLPADIVAALEDVDAPRWLVATPLHLRSCAKADIRMPALAGVLTAASPLDRDLAVNVEARLHAPVLEIYGSTETGVIGTRRTAQRDAFVPLSGVTVNHGSDGIVVRGGHVDAPVLVRDHAIVDANGSLTLTGRDADLVKIGGKRASLAMLDAALVSIAGVVDGAFVATSDATAGQRLTAVVVAPSVSEAELLAALRARIDPVFMPRRLRRVSALARNALGKLSAASVAEALRDDASQNAEVQDLHVCEAVVPAAHPALPGHFPGRPIVPAAWILTLVAAACGSAWGYASTSLQLQRARFRAPLVPDAPIRMELRRAAGASIVFTCVHGAIRIADGAFIVAGAGDVERAPQERLP